jgi:hypothetical protein
VRFLASVAYAGLVSLVVGICGCSVGRGDTALATGSGGAAGTPVGANPQSVASFEEMLRRSRSFGGSPTPSAAPVSTPSSASSASSGLQYSASNFVNVVDGQAWPANFRPYCANPAPNPSQPCPFNDRLPDNPSQLYADVNGTSAGMVASAFGGGSNEGPSKTTVWFYGQPQYGYDALQSPVYFAKASDPLVTVRCTQAANCFAGSSDGYTSVAYNGTVQVHVPVGAQPGCSGCDSNLAVVQPDGTEYDFWLWSQQGSTATAGAIAYGPITGEGTCSPGGCAANGTMQAFISNSLRPDELAAGVIPHALSAVVPCASTNLPNGAIFPGSAAAGCNTNSNVAPPGARWQLTLTDPQIDALNAAPWEKAILHAMHDYGVYTTQTIFGDHPTPGPFALTWASPLQWTAFGQPNPWSSFNWSSPGNNGGVGMPPTNWHPGGINWASSLRIVAECYAKETCSS